MTIDIALRPQPIDTTSTSLPLKKTNIKKNETPQKTQNLFTIGLVAIHAFAAMGGFHNIFKNDLTPEKLIPKPVTEHIFVLPEGTKSFSDFIKDAPKTAESFLSIPFIAKWMSYAVLTSLAGISLSAIISKKNKALPSRYYAIPRSYRYASSDLNDRERASAFRRQITDLTLLPDLPPTSMNSRPSLRHIESGSSLNILDEAERTQELRRRMALLLDLPRPTSFVLPPPPLSALLPTPSNQRRTSPRMTPVTTIPRLEITTNLLTQGRAALRQIPPLLRPPQPPPYSFQPVLPPTPMRSRRGNLGRPFVPPQESRLGIRSSPIAIEFIPREDREINRKFKNIEKELRLIAHSIVLPKREAVTSLFDQAEEILKEMEDSDLFDESGLDADRNSIKKYKEEILLKLNSRDQLLRVLAPLSWTPEALGHCFPVFKCPLTKIELTEPVIASDGHTYNRAALLERLERANYMSPVTGELLTSMNAAQELPLAERYFLNNHGIRSCIINFNESKDPAKWLSQNLDKVLACCVLNDVIKNPCVAIDGYSYDESILESLKNGNSLSPHTRQPLRDENSQFKHWPNHALKAVIDAYSELHPETLPSVILTAPKLNWSTRAKELAPAYFRCAADRSVLVDPVVLSDGHTYNRASILKRMEEGEFNSPKTRKPLTRMRGKSTDYNLNNYFLENKILLDCLKRFLDSFDPDQLFPDVTHELFLCPVSKKQMENPMINSDCVTVDASSENTLTDQRQWPNHAFKQAIEKPFA